VEIEVVEVAGEEVLTGGTDAAEADIAGAGDDIASESTLLAMTGTPITNEPTMAFWMTTDGSQHRAHAARSL
jgi:hypothetical protein